MSSPYLPLATIARGLSLYFLFGNMERMGKYDGIGNIAPIALGRVALDTGCSISYLVWIVALLVIWCSTKLLAARPGRAIRTLSGSTTIAEAMGVATHAAGSRCSCWRRCWPRCPAGYTRTCSALSTRPRSA